MLFLISMFLLMMGTCVAGREFQAVFLSTTEPTHRDGSTRNPTRSLCDPYVFNTALTRAKSLVIAVGNPFLLLSMEKQMIKNYSKKANCWSTFLKACIDNGTLEFDPSTFAVKDQDEYIRQLCLRIQKVNPDQQESQDHIALKKRISELEASLNQMRAVPSNAASQQPGYLVSSNQLSGFPNAMLQYPVYSVPSSHQITATTASQQQIGYPIPGNQIAAVTFQQAAYPTSTATAFQPGYFPASNNQATAMQAATFQQPGYISSSEVSPKHFVGSQTSLQSPPLSLSQAHFPPQSDTVEQSGRFRNVIL